MKANLESALLQAGMLVRNVYPSGAVIDIAEREGVIDLDGEKYFAKLSSTSTDLNDPLCDVSSKWNLTKIEGEA